MINEFTQTYQCQLKTALLSIRAWRPVGSMLREESKWKLHKDQSTDTGHGGGVTRSNDEVSVMETERRGGSVSLLDFI